MTQNLAMNPTRQIVLDTETTGMNLGSSLPYQGHKIIEIGAVEVVNRRLTGNHFHVYINPKRAIDEGAFAVHGIRDEFLQDKPPFFEIADDFIRFIDGAELIIHNASFDVGFIDYEFMLMKHAFRVGEHCQVTDTLMMARHLFPGKRNNLDILCERFQIDNSKRTLHGALLDAELLAEVYLAMTGGQTLLSFTQEDVSPKNQKTVQPAISIVRKEKTLRVLSATNKEIALHSEMLDKIDQKSEGSLWRKNKSIL